MTNNSYTAIGWALTGEINSSQPNLSLLYQLPAPQIGDGSEAQIANKQAELAAVDTHRTGQSFTQAIPTTYTSGSASNSANNLGARVAKFSGPNNSNSMVTSSLYATSNTNPNPSSGAHATTVYGPPTALTPTQIPSSYGFESATTTTGNSSQSISNNLQQQDAQQQQQQQHQSTMLHPHFTSQMSDMLIESQDIDMAAFHNQAEFPFTFSNDFNPYLEYLPPDVINYFGDPSHNYGTSLISPPDGSSQPQEPPQQQQQRQRQQQ